VPLFLGAVWLAYQFGLTKPWYWIAIAACRTWGTDVGDMLVHLFRSYGMSRAVALWTASAISAALLAAVIYFWTQRNAAPAIAEDTRAN
jgi:uncharacterized membrane-anchored protein